MHATRVPTLPLRVRAFVLVRWPRTGRPCAHTKHHSDMIQPQPYQHNPQPGLHMQVP